MKKHVLFIATAAAMLAGCAKEVEKPIEEQTGKLYTITALVDNPETRTVTQYNSETNKYKFSWSENETISVVSVNPSAVLPFQVSDANNGVFYYTAKPDEPAYTTFGMAVTPANALMENNPTPDNFSLELSGDYLYGQSNALMIAGAPDKNGDNYKFQFKHAAALVQVTYNDIPAGTKAMVLTATETGKVITGIANLTSATAPVAMSSLTGTTSNEARVNYASALTSAKSSDVFYVPIPTGSYQAFEIKLVDGSNKEIPGSKFVIDAGGSVNVTVGNVLMFPAKTVTSSQLIPDGVYAIALLNESHLNRDIMMKAISGDDQQGYMTLTTTFDENGKLSVPPVAAWKLEYDSATSSYSIKSMSENKYLEGRAGAAYLSLVDNNADKSKFYITSEGKDSDGNNLYRISVKSTTEERWIGFNYANGSGLFRTYENSTDFEEVLCLIPASSGLTPSLTFPNETKTVHADATSVSFEYVAQNLAKNPEVTITSNVFDVVASTPTPPTVDADNNQVVVKLNPNTDTAEKTATLTVSCEGVEDVLLTVIQSGKTGNVVDVITKDLINYTSYTSWANLTCEDGSSAVYAGRSMVGHGAIQINSDHGLGIISTQSGGTVKKVTVSWESNTTTGRTLNVYGKNTEYLAVSELDQESDRGTLIGTIVCGTSTELVIPSDYKYIGLKSASKAMYLSEIRIEWQPSSTSPETQVAKPVISCSNNQVSITCTTDGASIYYTTDNSTPSTSSTPYTGPFSITGTVTVKAFAVKNGLEDSDVSSETFKASIVDILTASMLPATNSSYVDFSNISDKSGAKYAGNSANNSGNIQLRSKNSNSGIVSTASGGKVKSIKISIASGSNTIDVYGNNTAYTSAADLYATSGNTNQGTKLGSLSETGTITVSGDYAFVGIRSNNGAVYISSIEITWE